MEGKVLHLVIKGRVQGVGFRWFVADAARRLDLAGWVRNNPDGSVELCALGDETAIDEFEKRVRKGPRGASVAGVESVHSGSAGEMTRPFSIARE